MVSSGRRHHRETGWGAGEVTSDAAAPLCHVEDIHAKSCREKPRRDIRWSVPCRAPRAASPLAVASPMPPTHGGGLVERCVAICTWAGETLLPLCLRQLCQLPLHVGAAVAGYLARRRRRPRRDPVDRGSPPTNRSVRRLACGPRRRLVRSGSLLEHPLAGSGSVVRGRDIRIPAPGRGSASDTRCASCVRPSAR
jgi:hypothetical protein